MGVSDGVQKCLRQFIPTTGQEVKPLFSWKMKLVFIGLPVELLCSSMLACFKCSVSQPVWSVEIQAGRFEEDRLTMMHEVLSRHPCAEVVRRILMILQEHTYIHIIYIYIYTYT